MVTWENKLAYPNGTLASYHKVQGGRYFELTAELIKHSILPEIKLDIIGYNGTTPGPLLVVKQGEWVHIKVNNSMDKPTSLHVHGLSKPNTQDGIPEIEPTPKIMPGESYTYQFVAWQSGTFFYHAGDPIQAMLGLLGPMVVLPNYDQQAPDQDIILVLQQWDIPQPKKGEVKAGAYKPEKFDMNPNFFTINGKSFPATSPIYTNYGQKVRVRFINKSSNSHSMHVHGHDFNVIEVDGFGRNEWLDTVNVPSGRRVSVEFTCVNPGRWPINGTKSFHQTNNGVAPGGMITRLMYE
jgi:FtsP/CotA-like multicopper oxidase with cupredoxin domain